MDTQATQTDNEKPTFGKRPFKQIAIHFTIWILMTAYITALSILSSKKDGFELAIIVYIFITLRLLAKHISMTKLIYTPISIGFNATIGKGVSLIPEKFRLWVGGSLVGLFMLVVLMVSPIENENIGSINSRLQSFLGVFVCILLLYITSNNRKAVPFKTVIVGMLLQFLIALFVLKSAVGVKIFSRASRLITTFLETSHEGLEFLFGPVPRNSFAVNVLPAIIFFCAFINVVYYFGGMQYIVSKFAKVMMLLMDTSGAESVVAAASPFVGMGESALLVKPFVQYMTLSELHSTMTSGFATIAGSVLLAYIGFMKDTSALLTACVMSIPASLLVSKLRYPEIEQPITKGEVKIPENEEKEANFLHAAGNGAATGVHLILLISASLLAIVTLFSVANSLVGWAFNMVGIRDTLNDQLNGEAPLISIQYLLSFLFSPVAFLIGVPLKDCRKAAEFMASKMVVNEFVAYRTLSQYALFDHPGAFTERSINLNAIS